jgi:hypothetical protein
MRDQRSDCKKEQMDLEITKIPKKKILPKRRKVKFKNQFIDIDDDGYYS